MTAYVLGAQALTRIDEPAFGYVSAVDKQRIRAAFMGTVGTQPASATTSRSAAVVSARALGLRFTVGQLGS